MQEKNQYFLICLTDPNESNFVHPQTFYAVTQDRGVTEIEL